MSVLFDGELFAGYHQLVLRCADADDLPTEWDDMILKQRIFPGEGSIIIATIRNMMAPLRVELHAARPTIDPASLDQLVETAIDVPSGQLHIEGLISEPTAPHNVPAGRLGALITFERLSEISEDGLDGDDRYGVHFWPSAGTGPIGVTVLKQWIEPGL